MISESLFIPIKNLRMVGGRVSGAEASQGFDCPPLMPSAVAAVFLSLLLAVVPGLADRLHVVFIPEAFRITAMRFDVVSNRAVGRWMFADQQHAGLLADPAVALMHPLLERLPPGR